MTRALPAALWSLVGAVVTGGCLAQPDDSGDRIECTQTSDCRTGEGEVCDEGVCWGDPPEGQFAAVLGPPSLYNSVAVTTELPLLALAADGWFRDADGNDPALSTALRVTGQVRTPCPPALEGCVDVLVVPGTLRWSRASRIPGLPDVTLSAAMAGPLNAGGSGAGFELYLPRPVEATTYAVTFTPSTAPLGGGLPSPAAFLPPYRAEVVIDPADGAALVRDFMLPSATSGRTLSGRISQVGATSLDGWQVRAEAGDGTVLGTFALASNITRTSATGEFTLAIVDDPDVALVDLVLEPPGASVPGGEDGLPRVRLRDHVLTSPLATIALPRIDRIIATPVEVEGTDGSGSVMRVSGASVVARLDQQIGGVFLQHQSEATTAEGVASLQVLLGAADLPLAYEVDVLPGPLSEMASIYGVDLVVADVVPAPPPIVLPRGTAMVGTVFDETGFGLPGATVTASVSAASLCELSSEDLRVARGLAPVQAATDANGEFTLFVDPDLDGTPLSYDITVEPSAGTWAPRWTFQEQAVTTEHQSLWLPAAAHVRARILDPSAAPAPDTVVTLYELTDDPAPCPVVAFGKSGRAVRRAIGTSDGDGVVRMILPRQD